MRLRVLLLAVLMLIVFGLGVTAKAEAFSDVPSSHAYAPAIAELSSRGIISGYTNGKFGLSDPVKRAQFAKMIVGTLGITPNTSTTTRFSDLGAPDAQGYPHRFVQTAYDNRITNGTNTAQTLFAPWNSIRRDQVVSMIVRGVGYVRPGTLGAPPAGASSDFSGVPEPHGSNLRIAEYSGLLDGLMGMGPGWQNANATRGEVAQMLANVLALGGVSGSKVVITSDVSVILDQKDATYQFSAVVMNGAGEVIDSQVTWASSQPSQLSISSSGLVTARQTLGSATITASAPGAQPACGSAVVATLAPDTVLVRSGDVLSAGPSAVLTLNDHTRSIAVGDVVMSGSEGSLFGRVQSVTRTSDQVKLSLVAASLTDAFRELHVHQSGPSETLTFTSAGESGALSPAADDWLSMWLSGQGPSCRLSLDGDWQADLDISWFKVSLFELAFRYKASAEVTTGSMSLRVGSRKQGDWVLAQQGRSMPALNVGPVQLGPSVKASVGVKGKAEADVALTVQGPKLNQSLEGTIGFKWTPQEGFRTVAENDAPWDASPFSFSKSAGFELSLMPYARLDAAISAKAGWFVDLADLNLAFIQGGIDFSAGLWSPFYPDLVGYTGPRWAMDQEFSGGLQLEVDGAAKKLLDLVGINPGHVDWELLNSTKRLAHSPYPWVTASPTHVSGGSVTLTAQVLRGASEVPGLLLDLLAPVEGAKVDFVGYKDAQSKYKVLASGTVRGGIATAVWQPSDEDAGTYHVTALLHGSSFSGLPYAAATTDVPPQVETVDVTVGSSAAASGQIAFAKSGGVWLINADGTGAQLITNRVGAISDIAWSKDGSHLAVIGGGQPWIMNADGSGLRRLDFEWPASSNGYSGKFLGECDWSPDGNKLVLSCMWVDEDSWGWDEYRGIYVVLDIATGRIREVGGSPSDDRIFAPQWHGSGGTVLANMGYGYRNVDVNSGVWSAPLAIYDLPVADQSVGWLRQVDAAMYSQDEAQIAYSFLDYKLESNDERSGLAVGSSDGANGRVILSGYLGSFSWSPDGRWIAVERSGAISLVPTAGSGNAMQLTQGSLPAWRPAL